MRAYGLKLQNTTSNSLEDNQGWQISGLMLTVVAATVNAATLLCMTHDFASLLK